MKHFLSACSALLIAGTAFTSGQEMPKEISQLLEQLRKDESGNLTLVARALLGDNGGNKLFYFPTNDEPTTPDKYGRKYENVHFSAADGTKLHGWFLPVNRGTTPLGTVVFSHGNAGALGHHLGFIDWMVDAGYQVFMYDYRGFGKSAGTPSRAGLVSDAVAAFDYTAKRPEASRGKIFSFGHSLGGAKSIVALTKTRVPQLRGVITDGTFASYEGMATRLAGNFGRNLVSDEFAPKDYVAKLPAPLLIVHGTDDEVVPIAQGRQLFTAAVPRKEIYEVKGGRHSDALARNNGAYRKKVLEWMRKY